MDTLPQFYFVRPDLGFWTKFSDKGLLKLALQRQVTVIGVSGCLAERCARKPDKGRKRPWNEELKN